MRSVEALRIGILAAALAIAQANDGTRPQWVPTAAEVRPVLIGLYDAAEDIGLDAREEFMSVADRLSGMAKAIVMDVATSR